MENVPSQKRERTYSATDYVLTIDMAKELCMIQRTERGKQARQYFLAVEKSWNSPQQVMARALQIANKQLASVKSDNKMLTAKSAQQEQILNELKPKANYVDMVKTANGVFIAKVTVRRKSRWIELQSKTTSLICSISCKA